MCRKRTPESEWVFCGRCGEVANPTDGREHGWPLRGKLDILFPAQAFGALCGMEHIAERHHFRWSREGHPAMTRSEAQHVTFEWGATSDWRLCYDCQKELLHTIGRFFKIPERADELREETEE